MHETRRFTHNTFWVKNQVSFAFETPVNAVDPIEKLINLEDLDAYLRDHGFTLQLLDNAGSGSTGQHADTALTAQAAPHDSSGIYVFPPLPIPGGRVVASHVATFFQFEEQGAAQPIAEQASQQDRQANQVPVPLSNTAEARIVNLVHRDLDTLRKGGLRLQGGRQLGPIPLLAAAPQWHCGASNGPQGQVTTGCPVMPPIPVAADATCTSSPGRWPIQLAQLPPELEQMTGDGVVVFVLDSLPKKDDIRRAATAAGKQNLLLTDLIDHVTFTYPHLPKILERPGPQQTKAAAKDIKGRAVGFRMPDHGLFVAGIIREAAPDAHIECIRVLNDFCAGTVQVLTEQLHEILQRILSGNLQDKDVVVNLSLVIPDDDDVRASGIDLGLTRLGLLKVIQKLAERGVIFVASAGNEGDRRYMPPKKMHPDALYPAAYAYPTLGESVENMIPVGAVNHDEQASSYSCFPGSKGVATYGGEVPPPRAIFKNKKTKMTEVDTRQLDAVIGVYTQRDYPRLSFYDPKKTYQAPNDHGWAYWIGTSFATPVISAVVARALQLHRVSSQSFAGPITTAIIGYAAKGQEVSWPVSSERSSVPILGPLILAQQCCPSEQKQTEEA